MEAKKAICSIFLLFDWFNLFYIYDTYLQYILKMEEKLNAQRLERAAKNKASFTY